MTISYKIDLSKTLTENVQNIHQLLFQELYIFHQNMSEWTPENIQQVLILSTHNWHLLFRCRNSFDISGLDLIKAMFRNLQFQLTGEYSFEEIERDLKLWKNQTC